MPLSCNSKSQLSKEASGVLLLTCMKAGQAGGSGMAQKGSWEVSEYWGPQACVPLGNVVHPHLYLSPLNTVLMATCRIARSRHIRMGMHTRHRFVLQFRLCSAQMQKAQ